MIGMRSTRNTNSSICRPTLQWKTLLRSINNIRRQNRALVVAKGNPARTFPTEFLSTSTLCLVLSCSIKSNERNTQRCLTNTLTNLCRRYTEHSTCCVFSSSLEQFCHSQHLTRTTFVCSLVTSVSFWNSSKANKKNSSRCQASIIPKRASICDEQTNKLELSYNFSFSYSLTYKLLFVWLYFILIRDENQLKRENKK